MQNVQRYDAGSINPLRPARRMADGRVRVDAYISRVGVFRYVNADGTERRELRHPDDVGSKASLESFEQVPVTNNHPTSGLVTSRNARQFAVGATASNVHMDGDHVATEIVVYDSGTVADMDAGKVQISGGYTCDLEMTPGVDPKYGRYDARQRNIRGNHVAIVDDGRAGPTVRARMDGAMIVDGPEQISGAERSIELRAAIDVSRSGGMTMNADDTLRAVNAQLKDAETKIETLSTEAKGEKLRADVADGELKVARQKITELQGQIASQAAAIETEAVQKEKIRADGLAAQVARFDETFKKAVRARAALEHKAAVVMGLAFRMDDLDERQIQGEVVKKLDSNADVSPGIPDGVVTGMFNALVAGYLRQARQIADVGATIAAHTDASTANEDSAASREDEAEKKRREFREQGMKPLPSTLRYRQT